MTTDSQIQTFLRKARESISGANSESSNGRYNNAANRCYYACFQVAIAALLRAGIRPPDPERGWSHAFVQAQFAQLVRRRKEYAAELAAELPRAFILRQAADYTLDETSQTQATRAVRRATQFVETVQRGGGTQ